jgi:hypothetical protein
MVVTKMTGRPVRAAVAVVLPPVAASIHRSRWWAIFEFSQAIGLVATAPITDRRILPGSG